MKKINFIFLTMFTLGVTAFSLKAEANQKDKAIKLQFPVMSDIHIGIDSSEQRFEDALRQYKKVAPHYDAIAMVGDITTTGYISEYDTFNNILNKNIEYGAEKLISIGNHEYFDGINNPSKNLTDDVLKNRFIENTGMSNIYYDKWIKDYHFIVLGGEESRISNPDIEDDAIMSDTQYKWLEEKLAESTSPDKPIFVFLHQPIDDTTYGSELWGGVKDTKLKDTLNKYPQVILFSGHTHNLVDHPRTVYQDGFTMVNDGSVGYTWYNCDYGPGENSQGLLVNVYEDKVEVKSREFSLEKWLKTFEINVPFKKTINDTKNPKFGKKDTVDVSNICATSATLTFPKATDDTQIDGYVVKNNGQVIYTDYLKYWEDNTNEYYNLELKNLFANTTYSLEIYAMDAWNNLSTTSLKVKFTTGDLIGWVQSGDKWLYYDASGNKVTDWIYYKNQWYYLDNNGTMQTGWIKDRGTWYFLDNSGAMKTGWIKDNGTWYFLDNSGAMKIGWIKNGKWYFLDSSGAMKTGWIKDKGTWYFLDSSGAMKTGWIYTNSVWYFLNNSGAMKTGWIKENGKWYFLDNSGAMKTGWVTINNKKYYMNQSGVWIK